MMCATPGIAWRGGGGGIGLCFGGKKSERPGPPGGSVVDENGRADWNARASFLVLLLLLLLLQLPLLLSNHCNAPPGRRKREKIAGAAAPELPSIRLAFFGDRK